MQTQLPAISTDKAATFDCRDEDLLWSRSFGKDEPRKLLKTLIFVTTKYFGLRGAGELYLFDKSCVKFELLDGDDVLITYTEKLSKTNCPGLRNINFQPKTVQHFEQSSTYKGFYNNYCAYVSKVPQNAFEKGFWFHPKKNWKNSAIWYSDKQKIGKNHFNVLIKESYKEAGLNDPKLTLRSIRQSIVVQLDG